MIELYFDYFITLIICLAFCLVLFFNTIYKGKNVYMGYIFCTIAVIFCLYLIFTRKSIIVIKEHYQSYKSLNENDIVKINYYESINDYKEGYIDTTIFDKVKIKSFLDKAHLNKGLYFKDVTTRNGHSEYLAEIISNNYIFLFEIHQDVDNYKAIYFILPDKDKSINYIGRYYFND